MSKYCYKRGVIMNKHGFCLSAVLVIIGFTFLTITAFTYALANTLTFIMFAPDFRITNIISISMIIIGACLCCYFYRKS